MKTPLTVRGLRQLSEMPHEFGPSSYRVKRVAHVDAPLHVALGWTVCKRPNGSTCHDGPWGIWMEYHGDGDGA